MGGKSVKYDSVKLYCFKTDFLVLKQQMLLLMPGIYTLLCASRQLHRLLTMKGPKTGKKL